MTQMTRVTQSPVTAGWTAVGSFQSVVEIGCQAQQRGKRSEVTEMGWDQGRYYTRSKKVNGRVRREYIGTGRLAQLAAQMDAMERERRLLQAMELRHEKAELADIEADLKALAEAIDLVAHAALAAAGYRQHKRGEWRKRREQKGNTSRPEEEG